MSVAAGHCGLPRQPARWSPGRGSRTGGRVAPGPPPTLLSALCSAPTVFARPGTSSRGPRSGPGRAPDGQTSGLCDAPRRPAMQLHHASVAVRRPSRGHGSPAGPAGPPPRRGSGKKRHENITKLNSRRDEAADTPRPGPVGSAAAQRLGRSLGRHPAPPLCPHHAWPCYRKGHTQPHRAYNLGRP